MTYATIRGARQHSAANQQHVDRAVDMLFKAFGQHGDHRASPNKLRERLTDPRNVLLSSDAAVALVLGAGEVDQKLLYMCVDYKARGQGIGGALLEHIVSAYTADHLMELECPAASEHFYKRQGFHRASTANGCDYVYMAGPGESESDALPSGVRELLPWECPKCNSRNGATRLRCACGYRFRFTTAFGP